jgi:radical SAM protein with 4Fe4S-binding SPASM domain
MYDIHFIQNTEQLKEEIAEGKWNDTPREEITKIFEDLINPNPYIFNLETTNHCNMTCVMCPRTELMTRNIKWFKRDLLPGVLDQITAHSEEDLNKFKSYIENKYHISEKDRSENSFYYNVSSRCLTLHGYGEPILDPHIPEIVSMCTERGIPTYFSCVPANIRMDRIEKLMEAGLGVLKFSIDALNDQLAKDIRGKRNNFTSAMKNIDDVIEFKAKHPEFSTKIVTTMISLSSSEERREMEENFLDLWEGIRVYPYIKSQDNRWLYEDQKEPGEVDTCTKEYCEYPWTSMTIMADGSVVPCTQDYDVEMVMGNVYEESLKEIWNGEKYREFREWHITGNFPKGYKCSERCDQCLVADRLDGKPRTRRVI